MSWRSCVVRSIDRRFGRPTAGSWRRPATCCRGSGGRCFWSRRRRSCAGTAGWSRSAGPIHDDQGIRRLRTSVEQRSECLDWLLILSARHLKSVLAVFIGHYNGWRPHRSLDLAPPNGRTSTATWPDTEPITLKRRDRLGGLLHEYERAA